jgi:serine/threonine-protein kinase
MYHESDLAAAVADRFTIERELGGGGMSRVFVAHETTLERRVVIKFISPAIKSTLSLERFRREMLLVASLQHTNIVPVLSSGEANGLLYYTMPYVEGQSLRERLEHVGKLPVSEAISVLRDVLRALSYAHERKIVHRDIKPDNILLSHGGAMVVDFGIAKAIGAATQIDTDESDAITQTGLILGTPSYIAPEQATPGAAIDHRADLYAVGCVAYEMLAGERLFPGRAPHMQLVAHVTEKPPLLSAKRSDAGEALTTFVARCLEKDPERRPASANDALRMLRGSELRLHAVPTTASRIVAATVVLMLVAGVTTYLVLPRQLVASIRVLIQRKPPVMHVNRVVVTQFENLTGDPSLAALGAMMADFAGEGL